MIKPSFPLLHADNLQIFYFSKPTRTCYYTKNTSSSATLFWATLISFARVEGDPKTYIPNSLSLGYNSDQKD